MVVKRHPAFEQRPPDKFVGGVVAAYVLLEGYKVSLRVEERRRVQPTCRLEESLRLSELAWQRVDHLCRNLRSCRGHRATAQFQLFEARLPTHTAGARRVEVAFQGPEVVAAAVTQLHVHYVVLLLGVEVGIHTVADLEDVLGRGD